eukprot:m.1422858 g.1422858  ORF g.1422858 m.1422858 type:complete len:239 (-) comp25054_c1_seq15:2512-3228(-)
MEIHCRIGSKRKHPNILAFYPKRSLACTSMPITFTAIQGALNDVPAQRSKNQDAPTFVPNYLRHPEFFYAASLSDDGTKNTDGQALGRKTEKLTAPSGDINLFNYEQQGSTRSSPGGLSNGVPVVDTPHQGLTLSESHRRASECFDVWVTIKAKQVQRKFTCVSPDTTIQDLMNQLKLFCDGDSVFMSLDDSDGGTILPTQTCGVLRAYVAQRGKGSASQASSDVLRLNITSFSICQK